ncbi:hypothetical protein Nmel_012707, partial [Mimus melanotis]
QNVYLLKATDNLGLLKAINRKYRKKDKILSGDTSRLLIASCLS